jgi:hypothetical protein
MSWRFGAAQRGATRAARMRTSDPVVINAGNGGNCLGTSATNPRSYRNNSLDDPGAASIDTEMPVS